MSAATLTACPSWCRVDHTDDQDGAAGSHAGESVRPVPTVAPVMLYVEDRSDAQPGVSFGRARLSEAEAHNLGMALVRAADVLRREPRG